MCENHRVNEKILSPKSLKLIRLLYYIDLEKITKIKVDNNIKKEIDEFIDEYYDKYSGLYLNSKKFLKNIKLTYVF